MCRCDLTEWPPFWPHPASKISGSQHRSCSASERGSGSALHYVSHSHSQAGRILEALRTLAPSHSSSWKQFAVFPLADIASQASLRDSSVRRCCFQLKRFQLHNAPGLNIQVIMTGIILTAFFGSTSSSHRSCFTQLLHQQYIKRVLLPFQSSNDQFFKFSPWKYSGWFVSWHLPD